MTLTEGLIKEYVYKAYDILEECCPEFERPENLIIEITWAKSFWAQVSKPRDNTVKVRVSKVFNSIPDYELFNLRLTSCMIHELIHTIPGCMNHQGPFKRQAYLVNRKYPEFQIQRATSMEDYGIEKDKKKLDYKYQVTCTKCGAVSKYKRKPQIWYYVNKGFSPYKCCRCGGNSFYGDAI